MPLTPEQKSLLELMTVDNRAAGAPYAPTDFWDLETRRFEASFAKFGINQVEDEFYNTRFSGLLTESKLLYPWFIRSLYHLLKTRDHLGILSRIDATAPLERTYTFYTKAGVPPMPVGHAVMVEGRKMSVDLLLSVHEFYAILDIMPELATAELVVVELGAGWGRLAHLMMQVNPRLHYLVLDIPATLLISETRLPQLMPSVSVASYRETREQAVLTSDWLRARSFAFAGPQKLPQIEPGAVDLFIQVGGLQEMIPAQVNAYLQDIDGVMPRGKVFLKNFWQGVRSNYADYRFPARWRQLKCAPVDYAEEMYETAFDLA